MSIQNFMGTLCEKDNRIHGLYASWAKAKGINYNMLAVLCSVYKRSGCTQRHICDEWCLAKQTVNTTCKELIFSGWLVLEQGQTDKRETSLALTDKGRDFVTPIVEELNGIEERIYNKLSSGKVDKLMKLYMEYAELTEAEFEQAIKQSKGLL